NPHLSAQYGRRGEELGEWLREARAENLLQLDPRRGVLEPHKVIEKYRRLFTRMNPSHAQFLLCCSRCGLLLHGLVYVSMMMIRSNVTMAPSRRSELSHGPNRDCNTTDIFK
ncbi:hypothetical protein PFISCL1PPCAC_15613, partial [Pristionchus fissidentatus]